MNILMMTNTYKPLVGGLEISVEHFTKEFRERGHRVVIVTPQYPGMEEEEGVVRVKAIQNFNGSDFSVQLPVPGALMESLGDFHPDIVHSHHPFLIGDTALRVASHYNVPLVFTHHTLYEENVHYVPGNEESLKRFVIELSTGYANLADQVFAPSESVQALLYSRGVTSPVEVVPTGIYGERFIRGAGKALRKKLGIPADAFVVGHVGRLAPEKNLEFLARSVCRFMEKEPQAHFLVAGKGPSEALIRDVMLAAGLGERLHFAGVVKGKDLADAYHAMDVFVFASHSETQGLVIAEAMAARLPVVAVDAPGVREVVKDQVNGRLLDADSLYDFVDALVWMKRRNETQIKNIKQACGATAKEFAMKKSADKALAMYASCSIVAGFLRRNHNEETPWARTSRMIQAQWGLVKNLTKATGAFMSSASHAGQAVALHSTEVSV